MTPMAPKISNARRHETRVSTQATRSGVSAPAHRVANQRLACARSRSPFGSQVENARVIFGKAPSLADAEQRAGREQRRQVPHPAGRRGEERPPDDDAHQHAARADAVAEPASRDLEQCVGPSEREEGPSHLHATEAEVGAHGQRGLGDAHAIDVHDDRERDPERHHHIPRTRRDRHVVHRVPWATSEARSRRYARASSETG